MPPLHPLGVPFCSGRFAHALSLVSSFKLPSAFPFSRPVQLATVASSRSSRTLSSSRPGLLSLLLAHRPAVFTLIVAVLLNPLCIVRARARRGCCSKKIGAHFENVRRPRCSSSPSVLGASSHPSPRSSVHLRQSRGFAREIGFHSRINTMKRSTT